MNFEQEINSLKDALIVMTEIQRRQADVQRMQAERTAEHEQWLIDIRHTLDEVGDKLNGLIGFLDGWVHRGKDDR